ncbi:histidine kinase [Alicyclobacillus sp. SO9]|uniref:sensor histidine kinase n=1 Tax=Alicyclobacillus sp. SO9 TaxID=2665646 RepID=UPI0018E87F47|nr:histidine kinase [Alicyclobacillus sp. SO9]QQE78282.1 PAS domain S-box protein [Alicyclobacillus sp. SO9]
MIRNAIKLERIGGFTALLWVVVVVTDIVLNVVLIGQATPRLAVRAIGIATLSLAVIFFPLGRLVWIRRAEYTRFRELFTLLSDGIIVMNPERTITFINPSAVTMTGFKLHDSVPYCLYCQNRSLLPGQQRCLLADERKRHYFESELPTNSGNVPVGMSRTFLSRRAATSEQDMVITIRDVTAEKREEELQLSRRLTHHAYKIQEEERKRLSQDLHDGISQTLYGIGLGLEHLSRHLHQPESEQEVRLLHQQVKEATEEVRSISHSLYPAALDRIGLVATLRTMAQTLCSPRRTVRFSTNCKEEPPFHPDASVHLYRITQEALHNAVMHGHAAKIHIALLQQGGTVRLTVEDNGLGFSMAESQFGYGLRNMEERARAVGAQLTISSERKRGTKVELTVGIRDLELPSLERVEK